MSNPFANRQEVINHFLQVCNDSCGWNVGTGSLFSTVETVSGDLTLDIVYDETVGFGIKATGAGEVLATLPMKLSAYSSLSLVLKAYPFTPPESLTGKYWFGICDGPGVLMDLDTQTLAYVLLDSAGNVTTTYNAVDYRASTWPPISDGPAENKGPRTEMGWCPRDCERLSIFGEAATHDSSVSSIAVSPLVHWPVAQPHTDHLMAFGSTVPSADEGTYWDIRAICGAICGSCLCYLDWPTPGEIRADGIATLARYSEARFPVTVPGDLSSNASTINIVDPSGVQWIIAGWFPGCSYDARLGSTVVYDDGEVRINSVPSVVVWRGVFMDAYIYLITRLLGPCFIENNCPIDSIGYWFVAAMVEFQVYDVATGELRYTHTDGALWGVLADLPKNSSATTLERLAIYKNEDVYYAEGGLAYTVSCECVACPCWTFSMTTIGGGAPFCEGFNAPDPMHLLRGNGCIWAAQSTDAVWQLRWLGQPTGIAILTAGNTFYGIAATYELTDLDFCDGEAKTLTLVSSSYCTGWPAYITLSPTPCLPDNIPYIDPESWPGSIGLSWIPTAPNCDVGPPTTTESSSSTESTTTSTSTTTQPPLGRCCFGIDHPFDCAVNTAEECSALFGTWTADSDCEGDPCNTTSSTTGSTTSGSTTTGSTTSGSTTSGSTTSGSTTSGSTTTTTGSTTTASPCTGDCTYTSVSDACGTSPTGFSWQGSSSDCSAGCGAGGTNPCDTDFCGSVVTSIGHWPTAAGQTATLPCGSY